MRVTSSFSVARVRDVVLTSCALFFHFFFVGVSPSVALFVPPRLSLHEMIQTLLSVPRTMCFTIALSLRRGAGLCDDVFKSSVSTCVFVRVACSGLSSSVPVSVLLRALCVCMCVCVCVFVSVITREMLSKAPLDASLALLKQQGAHVQHNGGIKRLLADCPARWHFSQVRVADLSDLPQAMQHHVPFWSGECVSTAESEEPLVMSDSICKRLLVEVTTRARSKCKPYPASYDLPPPSW